MSCQPHEDLLYDYVAQRLSDEERTALEAHLESCDVCRKNLELIRQTLPLLDSWEAPEVSAQLTNRIVAKAREYQIPWWRKLLDRITLPTRFMLPMQGLAAAALILTIYMGFSGIGSGDGKTGQGARTGVITGIQIPQVAHPIQIKVKNIEVAMTRLSDLVEEQEGKLIRKRNLARVVTLKIKKGQEKKFLEAIGALGEVQKTEEGYKDADGNIVIVLQE
jgi:anti-sigma factor RsiW